MSANLKRPNKVESMLSALRSGKRSALARAITLIESRSPAHREIADQLLVAALPYAGNSIRVGITGVPGVGKSTFIESLGSMLTTQGRRLAVLAVDPSSSRTHGSIMGDKTRMVKLSIDPRCYVRPSPTSGELGGVAAMTRETIVLCEAAGFDVILVETVGVGQSENAVADMVDFFLALMLPGAGDDLQGIKKGIIELADMIVVNKADGANLSRAELAAQQYRRALQIVEPKDMDWRPPTLLASALQCSGLDEIWVTIAQRCELLRQSGRLREHRRKQDLNWFHSDFDRQLQQLIERDLDTQELRVELNAQIGKGLISPTHAARKLANRISSRMRTYR